MRVAPHGHTFGEYVCRNSGCDTPCPTSKYQLDSLKKCKGGPPSDKLLNAMLSNEEKKQRSKEKDND